ncbi:hypothetical protein ES708_29749 [subsurface metagenome]
MSAWLAGFCFDTNYLRNFLSRHLTVCLAIHSHRRSQGTGTDAGYRFQAVLHVFGSLSGLNAQPPFQLADNTRPTPHVAGRPPANDYLRSTGGGKLKLSVKGAHPENGALGQLQESGEILHRLGGQIAELLLGFLEYGDKVAAIMAVVGGYFLRLFSEINFHWSALTPFLQQSD